MDPFQEPVRIALGLPQPPDAVADQEGVEHVGADVEGIVRLQQRVQPGVIAFEDRPGQQHAQGLAADQADADHAVPDLQNVAHAEIGVHQPQHGVIVRQHHAAQTFEDLAFAFRPAAAGPHVIVRLLGFMEDPPPEPDQRVGAGRANR